MNTIIEIVCNWVMMLKDEAWNFTRFGRLKLWNILLANMGSGRVHKWRLKILHFSAKFQFYCSVCSFLNVNLRLFSQMFQFFCSVCSLSVVRCSAYFSFKLESYNFQDWANWARLERGLWTRPLPSHSIKFIAWLNFQPPHTHKLEINLRKIARQRPP